MSFISLKLILPPLAEVLVPGGAVVASVKPQFEVGKEKLSSDGVVKNEINRDVVLAGIRACIESEIPWSVNSEVKPPIQREKGNLGSSLHAK